MRQHPHIRFGGGAYADRAGIVFAEIRKDLLAKVETGEHPDYPAGFLHTSTEVHDPPHYYGDMWSRDAARGIIELARLGYAREARLVCAYALEHRCDKGYWSRIINWPGMDTVEADGNAGLLLALYNTWIASDRDNALGREYLEKTVGVFDYFEWEQERCPYGYLAPCSSEMSGNPETAYRVYAIYPNYGLYYAYNAFARLAEACGDGRKARRYAALAEKLHAAIGETLVSRSDWSQEMLPATLTPRGLWLNGLDGRDGSPFDVAVWGSVRFPIHKWTRQLPFIQGYDAGRSWVDPDDHAAINGATYRYIADEMCKGVYFRKYGFASSTTWEDKSGRHDDTMAGYAQNFFTQAALLQDDTNRYTKCLEGLCRLAYDGDVVEHLAHEMNPWVMHECFSYANYEQGLDHTFGCREDRARGIHNNPGDEGNLVQSAETLKTFALVCGVSHREGTLVIAPRLPWEWTEMELLDYPVFLSDGGRATISLTFSIDRWRSRARLRLTSDRPFEAIDVRFGPFPRLLQGFDPAREGLETQRSSNTVWLWKRGLTGDDVTYELVYAD